MTKSLIAILIFISTNFYGQALLGGLKAQIYEQTNDKEGRRSLANETITVVINDTIKLFLKTDQDGYVTIKNLIPGKYNVKTVRTDCLFHEIKGIIIGEGKTAFVTYQLTCTSYLNSLTKKQRKKLRLK